MFEKIKKTVLMYVEYDEKDITPETEFLKDLHMTSYDIISMIGELENEFGITVDEEDLREIVTVNDLTEYLREKVR